MTMNIIVILSLLLAFGYFLTWLLRRDFRERIESPKYDFQDKVAMFDRQYERNGMNEDEPDDRE